MLSSSKREIFSKPDNIPGNLYGCYWNMDRNITINHNYTHNIYIHT